jgi:predicted acyl esterase
MKKVAAGLVAIVVLVCAPSAGAAIPSVFGGQVSCSVQGNGVRFCGSTAPRSTVKAFDGVPLDVNVAFPPQPASGPDGNYPLVMIFHGYGGGKLSLSTMQHYLDMGYATFSMTDRGFRESCGSLASRTADPSGCANGYVRLIDTRYEVRDAQDFAGMLADEGLVAPKKIGAIGGSYGGGVSIALAALKNRMMLPDDSLVPWKSPGGKAMEIAAAAPFITWSDLAYSLTPNGSTLDYVASAPYRGRFGVMKESLVNGLYVSGLAAPGFYAPAGADPSADITGWRTRLLAGEPYDGDPAAQAVLDEITGHHSAFYIDHSVKPAPMLLANSFTDDLFPVDEMVRFYNRTRDQYPSADISLFAAEIRGHPRSQTKPDALAALQRRQDAWFDHYVKGTGKQPKLGVTAMTETCPAGAPSGGPISAPNWAKLSRGEIRLSQTEDRTIAAGSGDPAIANVFDPVTGGGACATASAANEAGTVNYRTKKAPKGGYLLLGSPTVIADFTLPGKTSQVAARLLDVDPATGLETLVARGLWRPASGGPTRQVFQLHPAAWQVQAGHVVKLELLAKDAGSGGLGGYGRPSDNQQAVRVKNLELRLPVREKPGARNGLIRAPKPKFVPQGYRLARDFLGLAKIRAHLAGGPLKLTANGRLRLRVICPGAWQACTKGSVRVKGAPAKGRGGRFLLAQGSFRAKGGQTKTLALPLTPGAVGLFQGTGGIRARITVRTHETTGAGRALRPVVR